MPLLFALLCFAIAGPALVVAFVAAHVWLAAAILLRLGAGQYVKAALWCCVLAALVCIDVSYAPASARYDLPQDYLDALSVAPIDHCADHFCSQQDVPNWWTPHGKGTYWDWNAPTMADAPSWLKYPTKRQSWHPPATTPSIFRI